MIDFNTEPYNDDFSEDNKFYRILFRPSFAVQARELTQLQTILQNQISKSGDHLFKQGAMVVPGQVSIDTNVDYVKVKAEYSTFVTETFIQSQVGKVIVGTSGIKAEIIKVVSSTTTDPTTLYIRYNSSSTSGTSKVFANDEVITTLDGTYSFQALASSATGVGSTATVERGIYYVNGFYVLCADNVTGKAQTIVLDKYTNTPTYRIGLTIVENSIVPEDDETLLDNAQSSYNFAAPGAHRYHIDLNLSKKLVDDEDDENFIELLQVRDGVIKRIVNKTEYSELEKTFARRTFDESGNYDVRPFTADVREARNNNRGQWVSGMAILRGDVVVNNGIYYTAKTESGTTANTAPAHTNGSVWDGGGLNNGIEWEYTEAPAFNRGVSLTGSADQLAIALDPGKAYVQGYEIEKVSTEYVYIDKTRDSTHQVNVDNALIPATVGNYILVNGVHSAPFVDTFATVSLRSEMTIERTSAAPGTAVGEEVGTARVRFIEWHNGTIGTNACQYKLGLFDIKMNTNKDFTQSVKSLYYNNSLGGAEVDFSADVLPVSTELSGTVTASASTTITGAGTSFVSDLSVGDYVYLGTSIRRVTAIASQNQITVDRAATVAGELVKRITTEIKESQNESLIFPFPYYAIKSAHAPDGTTQISYTVYERLTGTAGSASAGIVKVSMNTSSGTMASAAETDNYILVDNTTGLVVAVDPANIAPSGSSVEFSLPTTPVDYSGRGFICIAAVNKTLSSGTEKTKQLNQLTASSSPAAPTYTSQALATGSEILLGTDVNPTASKGTLVADAYRIISIKMATGYAWDSTPPSAAYIEDISDRYDLDDGQTATFYGISKLKLKPSYAPPTAPIRVEYEYFGHTTGDYFIVNSYNNIDYKFIPTFAGLALRDVIDFRPRISGDNATFNGSGGSISLVPKRGYDIQADFTYYLARKDKIAVDFNGNFFAIAGVPSLSPGEPSDPSIGMVLYTLTLEPYVFTTLSGSVNIKKHDNKRYTMRDIGKLENRINTLEYYTSLSLLEQETQSLEITDSATGLNRFKNGFVVDNFAGHNTGDTSSKDYFCSIDMEKNELRPFYSMKNVNLVESLSTPAARVPYNYKLWGDVITLPLDDTTPHVELVKQPYASRLENINPFSIFTFLGDVKMNPSSDEWFEVDRRPDIIQNEEGDFNTVAQLAEKAGVLGTVWNAWQTQWTGTPVSQGVGTYSADRRYGDGGAALDARFGLGPEAPGWARRTVTAETFAQQIGQSRTGINTRVVARIDTRQVADRVLSSAVIPFIRSRNVLIQTSGLKPSTKFYPFFDNVNVSQYITPATKISISLSTGQTGEFDTQTNVGSTATEDARKIGRDTQVCLNKGDLITGGTSGATAVVVGTDKEYNTDGTAIIARNVYVVNIKGTFRTGETITGTVNAPSAATATIVSVETPKVAGDSVVSNLNGEVQMLFNIPNTESIRFRTGQRQFVLTDSASNLSDYTSRGRGLYYANGVLETKQATFVSTRNAQLVQEQVADNQTIVETSERIVSDTGWYDPLAQTFLVQQSGGAFLSKVDVFFASKSITVPVTCEIREVINGFPGKRVLPFSRVTKKPEQVNISTNMVDLDGVQTPSYDTATTFEFPSPVYVQDNTEYALVLVSDSNGYKVWISNMGDKIPNSSRTISEQPYAGVLFKSQNGSTWTANQDQDLKFTLYRAKFKTNTVGTVQFVNDSNPSVTLEQDPFETNIGSNKVKVYQKDHGFAVNSKVTLANDNATKVSGVRYSGTITCNVSGTTVTGSGTSFLTTIGSGTTGQGTVLYGPHTVNAGSFVIGKTYTIHTAGNTNFTLLGASANTVGTSFVATGTGTAGETGVAVDGYTTLIGVVASVASNTSLTLVSNAGATLTANALNTPYIVVPMNGIPATEIYKQQTVSVVVDNESYVFETTTTAKAKGYGGGNSVVAPQNIPFIGVQPIAAVQEFSETSSVFSLKGTGGRSVNGSESTSYPSDATFNGIIANENNFFSSPKVIASTEVENSTLMSGRKSATLQCKISTSNDSLSPIIDTHRLSLVAISNSVNSPTESNINQVGLDDLAFIAANTTIGFTAATTTNSLNNYDALMYSSNETVVGLFGTLMVGKYLTITGAVDSANNGNIMITKVPAPVTTVLSGTITCGTASTTVTGVGTAFTTELKVGHTLFNSTGVSIGTVSAIASNTSLTLSANAAVGVTAGTTKFYTRSITLKNTGVTKAPGSATAGTITIVSKNHFIDEIAPIGGSSTSKYVTKKINLESAATFMKIRMAVNVPPRANLEVYYKTSAVGTKDAWTAINYKLATPDTAITKIELGSDRFVDVEYSLDSLTPFDAFSVKLVFKSTNTAEVPRVKDLRIVACS